MQEPQAQTHSHAHVNGKPSPQMRVVVPGIQNLGNTCFFNAILQALASVECFRDYLSHVVAQSTQRGGPVPFTKALLDCIIDLAPVGEQESRRTVVPRDLNKELVSKLAAFRGNKQQDSQELLQFLVNLVNDEQTQGALRDRGLSDLLPKMGLSTSTSSNAHGSLLSSSFSSSFTGSISDSCFEEAMEERRWNPLYGLQVNLLRCDECGHFRPMTNRRFLDVSLSFGMDATTMSTVKQVTLWDCLRLYTAPEEISGVECNFCTAKAELVLKTRDKDALQRKLDSGDGTIDNELALYQLQADINTVQSMMESDTDKLFNEEISDSRCRQLRTCKKQLQFSRCPDVFCFHFNRKVFHAYSGTTRKLDTHVLFPMELDMSPFCRFEQSANQKFASTNGKKIHMNGNGHGNGHGNGVHHHHQATPSWFTTTTTLPAFRGGGSSGHAGASHPFLRYELVAVILHHGNDRCGHFTAFRRVKASRQWFFISDGNVRDATEDEVLASCAYMLFYERKHRVVTKKKKTNGQQQHHQTTNGAPSQAAHGAMNGFSHTSNSTVVQGDDDESDGSDDDEDTEAALASVPDESATHHVNHR